MSLGQSTINPNQEIVVRFNTALIDSDEVQQAITTIKGQLQSIGVDDVQVSELSNGKLKVTYFSTKEVSVIEDLFLQHNKLQLGDSDSRSTNGSSEFPFSENATIYKLDVVKIQQDYSAEAGFQGTLVTFKWAKDQYVKPIFLLTAALPDFDLKYNIKSGGVKTHPNISLLINTSAYKIPEVRAGPLA